MQRDWTKSGLRALRRARHTEAESICPARPGKRLAASSPRLQVRLYSALWAPPPRPPAGCPHQLPPAPGPAVGRLPILFLASRACRQSVDIDCWPLSQRAGDRRQTILQSLLPALPLSLSLVRPPCPLQIAALLLPSSINGTCVVLMELSDCRDIGTVFVLQLLSRRELRSDSPASSERRSANALVGLASGRLDSG